nr:alpha/beta hydrolase [uncultured Niameybacter sp.]
MKKRVYSRKKVLIGLLIGLVVLGSIGFVGVGWYFYEMALNPTTSKEMLFQSVAGENTDPVKEEANRWFKEDISYEDWYINSRDNLRLHAYVVENPKPSNIWIVGVHGYMGNGLDMARCAKVYYQSGFNMLIPDLRGHGESEGDYVGMGWDDRLDLTHWVNLLIEKDPNIQIVLYGVSMGGATVMMASGESLPNQVKAIIEDCGYSSAWEEFSYILKEVSKVPPQPVLFAANIATRVLAGYWISEASAVKQVAKSTTPILFIHGEKDTFVPFFMLDKVYEAANCEKEKLVVKEAGHAASAEMDPDLYTKTVTNFLNKHLTIE